MTKPVIIIIGAGLTAVLFALVEFAPEIGLGGRVFMVAFAWAFLSFAIWSIADLFKGNEYAEERRAAAAQPIEPSRDLTEAEVARVAHIVAVMGKHGIFAPQIPDPELLHAGVVHSLDNLSPADIFDTLGELHYYHPAVPDDVFWDNIAMVPSHGEHNATQLAQEIADIDRLTRGVLNLTDEAIRWSANLRSTDVELAITVNGAPLHLTWRAAPKYASTVPHVALARAYAELRTGYRLATYWVDRGMWLMRLADGAVEALNAELGLNSAGGEGFGWLDAEEPFAADDPVAPLP